MLKLFRRVTTIGGVVALLRSPMGQQMTAKAQAYLRDPHTQQRITQIKSKLTGNR